MPIIQTPPPPPAPGEDESLALALANTLFHQQGAILDAIADPERAWAWLTDRRLVEPPAAAPGDDRTPAALRELRDAIRDLLGSRLGDQPPPGDAVERLNRMLAAAPSVNALSWEHPGPPQRQQEFLADSAADLALARVAGSALDLMTGPQSDLLAACGAPGCIRFLLRTHGKRHWCSTRCGNRVRAARHYSRNQPASG